MHEILPLLPLYHLNIQAHYIEWEGLYEDEKYIEVKVENHHYAEAYAQMYIKLKKEGLV